MTLSEIGAWGETILGTCKFDQSFNTLAFPYFSKGEERNYSFNISRRKICARLIHNCLFKSCARENGNLQLQVCATINWEEGNDIDTSESNMCAFMFMPK